MQFANKHGTPAYWRSSDLNAVTKNLSFFKLLLVKNSESLDSWNNGAPKFSMLDHLISDFKKVRCAPAMSDFLSEFSHLRFMEHHVSTSKLWQNILSDFVVQMTEYPAVAA